MQRIISLEIIYCEINFQNVFLWAYTKKIYAVKIYSRAAGLLCIINITKNVISNMNFDDVDNPFFFSIRKPFSMKFLLGVYVGVSSR